MWIPARQKKSLHTPSMFIIIFWSLAILWSHLKRPNTAWKITENNIFFLPVRFHRMKPHWSCIFPNSPAVCHHRDNFSTMKTALLAFSMPIHSLYRNMSSVLQYALGLSTNKETIYFPFYLCNSTSCRWWMSVFLDYYCLYSTKRAKACNVGEVLQQWRNNLHQWHHKCIYHIPEMNLNRLDDL